MKPYTLILCLVIFLVACTSQEPISVSSKTSRPTYTPPSNTIIYDGCAFQLNYPQELAIEGSGWYLFLGNDGQVFISADKAGGIGLDASLDSLLDYHGIDTSQAIVSSVSVVDSLGQEISGLQADVEDDGDHIRIWVILRPETLLGDLSPEHVVYQITVRTPMDTWASWESISNLIFQSFVPKDCGGV